MIVFDVDGVLTDGTILIDDHGVETKRFHVRDGMAISPHSNGAGPREKNRWGVNYLTGPLDGAGRYLWRGAGKVSEDNAIGLIQFLHPDMHRGKPRLNTVGFSTLAIAVTDIDTEYERLQAAGVSSISDSGRLGRLNGV